MAVAAQEGTLPPASVALTGAAVSSFIALDSTRIDFGDVPVGSSSAAVPVALTNVGNQPLQLDSIAAEGAEVRLGTIDLAAPVAAGGSRTFEVSFSPAEAGRRVGQVAITLAGASQPEAVLQVTATKTAATQASGCGCSAGVLQGLLVLAAMGALGLQRRRGRPPR